MARYKVAANNLDIINNCPGHTFRVVQPLPNLVLGEFQSTQLDPIPIIEHKFPVKLGHDGFDELVGQKITPTLSKLRHAFEMVFLNCQVVYPFLEIDVK